MRATHAVAAAGCLLVTSALAEQRPIIQQPPIVPPHSVREIANTLQFSSLGEFAVVCDETQNGIGRTPGINPAEEARLTEKIGPAYNAPPHCIVIAGPKVYQFPPRESNLASTGAQK